LCWPRARPPTRRWKLVLLLFFCLLQLSCLQIVHPKLSLTSDGLATRGGLSQRECLHEVPDNISDHLHPVRMAWGVLVVTSWPMSTTACCVHCSDHDCLQQGPQNYPGKQSQGMLKPVCGPLRIYQLQQKTQQVLLPGDRVVSVLQHVDAV
jgi:hypothetical protein